MAIRHSRLGPTRFGLAAFVALVLSSCVRVTYFPRVDEGRAPVATEVVVAGRIAFDPPIDPSSRQTNVRDPSGRYLRARLAFTRDLRPFADWREADGFAAVDPEQPFAIVVPRDQRYIRGVYYHLGTRAVNYQTTAIIDMVCDRTLEVPIESSDELVYVGTITCRHDAGQPLALEVRDELDRDAAAIAARFPGMTIARRILRAIGG